MTWDKGRFLETASKTGQTISYKYDFNGIRTEKTVNGTKTVYFYVGSVLISQKTGSEEMDFSYDASGRPYALKYNGTVYYYLLNLQGDVIGIYDSNGNIVVSYKYDAWGKLLEITGSLSDTVGEKNPLRYRGYYYDTETNLYYLQSRYYDPETCRFISADSLLVAGDAISGTNIFAYCLNNPVMYEDPSGRDSITNASPLVLIKIFSKLLNVFVVNDVIKKKIIGVDITDKLNEEMKSNAEELRRYKEEYGYAEAVSYFIEKVKPGGEWDLKSSDEWNLDRGTVYRYNGIRLRWDDLGNIHYGYVGRVLFSEEILLKAGGIVQILDGTFDWSFWSSNFDDPRDQWAISFGYNLWGEI